jgi:TRAP-type mannitol/chloroaromatic compound transport system substrate-binding protein
MSSTGRNKDVSAQAAGPSRRDLLAAAATTAAAAGAIAAPNVVRAQDKVTLSFQSTWPSEDIFHEFAEDYATKVNEMSGGRLELNLLPAGAVVGSLQMQDAVISGALDGGHGVTAYWYGKNKAYSLFGTSPPWGWNANQMLGWIKYGGGQQLYDELVQDVLGLDLVGFLTGPMPTQPLGWFQKEITSPEDLRNLKYRTVGLSADVYNEMGVAVTIMGGGDIVPALDRGLLDAAEFNNPSSDIVLGFTDVSRVYMVRSYHQACECFEIIFNKRRYESLAPDLQAILKYAAEAASADMSWKAMDRYSRDLQRIRDAGVQVVTTPEPVLQAQLDAWDKVLEQLSEDDFFRKVVESQKEWTRRIVGFSLEYEVDQRMAFEHFFRQA